VIWLIQDFDLLSVLLRALTLSFEALTLGGVLFLFVVCPTQPRAVSVVRRFCSWVALSLAIVQVLSIAESAIMLMGSSGMRLQEIVTADFFFADAAIIVAALLLLVVLRIGNRQVSYAAPPVLALVLLAASVALSHAPTQLNHRVLLIFLTAIHHLGTAAWIGAMPFLLVAMRNIENPAQLNPLVRRFSSMAMISVAGLVLGGIGLSYFYVGTWGGLYGTSYGVLVLAKIYLLLLTLALGAGNYFLLRRTRSHPQPVLMRLRRFSEVEIGLGFTAVLIAASLTSQPPAADTLQDQLTSHEIIQRLEWKTPSFVTPTVAQLGQRISLEDELESMSFNGGTPNGAMDRAWSEYNHHWAGLIVLVAGVLAWASRFRSQRWARNWPLLFLALAVFVLLRADPEAWPLGPRSFWGSFAMSEVLEHRVFVLLIVAFAAFEWSVATGRLRSQRAALVFPALCAIGGAFLLTHSHAVGDMKEETLIGMSHTPIALLGVTAGWSRWLQLRLSDRDDFRIAGLMGWIWPVCLALVGLILLNYREA
jgi:copper resistance protein D